MAIATTRGLQYLQGRREALALVLELLAKHESEAIKALGGGPSATESSFVRGINSAKKLVEDLARQS